MAKLKITQTTSITNVTYPEPTVDRYVSPVVIDGSHIGGTGGLTSQAGYQIAPTVKIGTNASAAGSVLAQKGSHKFRVTDGTNKGDCKLVNLATPTVSNTMSIQVNLATATAANLTTTTGSATTFAYVTYASANIAGPVAVTAGQVLTGTGITGTVTIQTVSVAGGLANANVSFTSQTVSNIAGTGTFSISCFASKINNKYVWDFGNDGYPVTSTSGSFTGGANNPTRYRYRLATPDATFVQVASA